MLKNISWSLLEKLIKIIFSLIIGVIVARILGPEEFGRYKYAMGLVFLFTPIATLGMESILIREFSRNPKNKTAIVTNAISVRFTLSILIAFVLWLVIGLLTNDFKTKLAVLIFSFNFSARSFEVFSFELRSKSRFKEQFIATIFGFVISTLFKIFILIFFVDNLVILLLIANVLEYLFSGMAARYFSIKINRFSISIPWLKKIFILTWKQALISSVIILYMKIDVIMIESILGLKDVGSYTVAVTISELWYFIPMSIVSVFYSKLVELYSDHLFKIMTSLILSISIISISSIFIIGEYLVSIFGDAYVEANEALKILMFAGLFVCFGLVQDKWFIIKNKENKLLFKTLTGLSVNVISNLFLIPYYGISGAALGTLNGLIFSTLISDLFFKETVIFKLKLVSLFDIIFSPIKVFKLTKNLFLRHE